MVWFPFILNSKNQLIKNIHTYLKRRVFGFSGNFEFFWEKNEKKLKNRQLVEMPGIAPGSDRVSEAYRGNAHASQPSILFIPLKQTTIHFHKAVNFRFFRDTYAAFFHSSTS